MPFYYTLNDKAADERQRTAQNLLRLRKQLRSDVPNRTVKNTLLLATWNIREFGKHMTGRFARLNESYFYIAEILSAFDLIALQEVDRDLTALQKMMAILGPSWAYFAGDTATGAVGVRRRLVFLYDTRKVEFMNMAGQVVLDEKHLIEGKYQFARPPYLVTFRSGWFEFDLCAVNIYYGMSRGEKLQRRIGEIDTISRLMKRRVMTEDKNVILLGDFNIEDPQHETMDALTRHGFHIPKQLLVPSNIKETHYYSQIAFMVRKHELQLGASKPPAGVFRYYDSVYRAEDFERYYKLAEDKEHWNSKNGQKLSEEEQRRRYQIYWRSRQMSDHYPLWVELKIDFSDAFLAELKSGQG
jgi:exonuclease III